MNILEVNELRKAFGQREVVKGISFVVEQGDIFGFLGKNGAGKSTTINMLTGIMPLSGGSFTMLGKPHSELNEVKKNIGVMPDAANYYADLTALAHMRYFAQIKGASADPAELLNLLEQVGLGGDEHKRLGQFSFGMKKKLGIAQALIGDPALIFLDEPTSGVDAESILSLHEIILGLKKAGKTIFLTSHNLSEVEKLCTRIAIMESGVIAAYGTLAELRARYTDTVTVYAEVPSMPPELLSELSARLGTGCLKSSYENDLLICELTGKELIPEINFWLAEKRLATYQVRVDQASLEEIFLSV